MPLDRLAPARRDACRTRPTGRQTWERLLFVHYEVAVEDVRRLVPKELEIDTFAGRAYIGLVPFTMRDVYLGPLRVTDFLETNVRTYVHADGVPGVWFLSLDAESVLAVLGARSVYRLPYFHARGACTTEGIATRYRLERTISEAAVEAQWIVEDARPHQAEPDTLAHFLTERYALYGRARRGGGIYRLRVHHRPWPLYSARVELGRSTLATATGLQLGRPIDLVLASPEGVQVETFAREQVATAGRH